MGAGCYLCELKYGTIPGHEAGDAAGACKQCCVLACLAHAVRNKNVPAYICGCCLPNLLTVAAIKQLGTGGGPTPSPGKPSPGDPLPEAPPGYSEPVVDINDVGDAISDLADERWAWMRDDMEYLSRLLGDPAAPAALRVFTRPSADRARALMAAAVAIATKLHLPQHEMIPLLQRVTAAVTYV